MKKIVIVLIALLLSGCGIQTFGNSMKASYYFSQKDYVKGVAEFSEKVNEHPDSASANYYLGRFYLAQNNPSTALINLERAVSIEPGESDYQFWLGVAAGASGDQDEERKRYLIVLGLSPSHDNARLYLAHLQLKVGQYSEALESYNEILERYPYNAAALYNKALCLKFLKQHKEEEEAWLEYLKYYPSGFLATKAVNHLNSLGNFSYRNHPFGYRMVTLKEIRFKHGSDALQFDSRQSMRLAGAILSNFTRGDMQLIVFYEGNRDVAQKRAYSLKEFLLKEYPTLDSSRIKLSWFDNAEIFSGNNKKYAKKESVRIYLTDWR